MTDYNPDVVAAPGETLQEMLEERAWSNADFAERIRYSTAILNALFTGETLLTDEMAQALERVLGTPAHFWLRREDRYRQFLAQQAALNLSELG